ncbi:MAG: S8 family serine peptidase [Sphingomonas sp.]|nr:S8 family serine peptidase [Sphingomonas sp.]
MNALTAYNAGGRGQNVKVGVIDSGIDIDSPEFTGRIDPASRSTAGNGTYDDEDGHGTAVAFTIAGRRNGTGSQGVAFDSTLIVLRTDTPGSCASADECAFSNTAIATALDVATQNGAKVVNISLGGGSSPGSTLLAAINRATQAGVIVVISAGNDGNAQPDGFASGATDPSVARGLVIIAGSVNTSDVISTFSNRAGSSANYYLTAVGERVRAPDETGTVYLWSGTSFSAPQIAGAVALIASAFPNMTGSQIVSLLYQTARDAGTAGIDNVYGRGVLDLARAFQPVGSLSLAGSRAPASTQVNGSLSTPMGDAATATMGAVVLDGFDRAYALDLARTIRTAAPQGRLDSALRARQRSYAAGVRDMTVAVTIVPGRDATRIERLYLPIGEAERARAVAGNVMGSLGSRMRFAIGASESGTALAARIAGQARASTAFLVAPDPTVSAGFDSEAQGAVALRRQVGAWGITVAAESGAVLTRLPEARFAALQGRTERFGYGRLTLAADRRFGPLGMQLAVTRLAEQNTVLGARFGGALGAADAATWFVDGGGTLALGDGWQLAASMRRGWTRARLHGGIDGGGLIRTSGLAFDVTKAGIFDRRDRFGLRVSQPLRVGGGGLDLLLPTSYTYDGARVDEWTMRRLNLAPTGREVDMELAYVRRLKVGDFSTNLFLRRDPGNYAQLPDDVGVALRYTLGF